jgi:hypothetical protein
MKLPWSLAVLIAVAGCGPRSVVEAESQGDVGWLTQNPSGESIAALGRLADTKPPALTAIQARAATDLNVHIAAWSAVTRNAAWGPPFVRASLADPLRADMASSALPRRDPRLVPFLTDLEGAVVRLAAGRRAAEIASLIASVGPPARAAVERRLVDAKTRGAMCDGIGLPDASGDSKSALLAVPAAARDNPSCVTTVMELAATEDVVADWIATRAEPGLLSVSAKSTLACARLAMIWKKGLTERAADAALTVPLQRTISRCGPAMDPVLAELLAKAPRARPTIVQAIDPFGSELAGLKETCAALKQGYASGESPILRERANDAVGHGCLFAR